MKLFLAFCLMLSTQAFGAESQVILDLPSEQVMRETKYSDFSETKFRVDFQTHEVHGQVHFYGRRLVCRGMGEARDCNYEDYLIKSYESVIEGMFLSNDKILFNSSNGEVECGVVAPGRIFRSAKRLILNGKCTLVPVVGPTSFQLKLKVK